MAAATWRMNTLEVIILEQAKKKDEPPSLESFGVCSPESLDTLGCTTSGLPKTQPLGRMIDTTWRWADSNRRLGAYETPALTS